MTTNTRQRFAQLPSTRLVLTLLFGMASLLLALPGRAIAATSQLDQSDVNGGCWVAFDDNLAQTFTAGITGDLDMVRVLVYGADLGVEIRKVAANGAPTGQLLGSETVERPAGTEDYRWYEVALDPPAPIISGSQYAIVLTRPSDSTVGDYGWITDCSGGYTGGDRWVYNGVWRNVGGDFAFQTYVVHKPDTAAPDTTIGTKPANPTNSTSASFSFNGDDGTGSGVASFECSLDGAAFANCASTGISYSDLSEGSHTFAVKATDNANNTDTTPASYTWTVDTTAPAQPATPDLAEVSDSGASSSDNVTHDNTPTLDGTAEANSTVTLYDGSTSLGSALVNSSGSWSFTPSTVSDGGHSFTATATDEAGNTSAASAALAVTIDTAAPMVHPPSNISVNATSPAGAVVSYGVSVTDVGSPGLVATCTSALTAGLASGSTFPIGTTTMTCTAQDAAGNSSATGTFTIAVQSASQQVTNLETKVQNVRLDPPTRRNLVRILQNAQSAITKGDIVGACDKLTSFSSQVQAQAGKKLAQATANDLITDAQRIKQVLGCS